MPAGMKIRLRKRIVDIYENSFVSHSYNLFEKKSWYLPFKFEEFRMICKLQHVVNISKAFFFFYSKDGLEMFWNHLSFLSRSA